MQVSDVRCYCGRLLGRVSGKYEIKCPRCKAVIVGATPEHKYDKVKGK